MSKYLEYPLLQGISIVHELAVDNLYQLSRSQTAIFPFKLDQYSAIRIDAGHSSFYDNQNGTISAWASDEINGRSITTDSNPAIGRVALQAGGFSWIFHLMDTDLRNYEKSFATQWIYPNQEYYMCFQNRENKDNGLYVRFTYLP